MPVELYQRVFFFLTWQHPSGIFTFKNINMNWASVCSGIGAPEMAWKDLPGWHSQWVSEIEPFPSKVLKHYYPDVPNLGDMTKLSDHEHYHKSTIHLLVGGTPCQSFSIAGLRGGLDDERGNLALEFCRILIAKLPKWFVWENVPGVFSSFSNDIKGTIEFKGKKWALSSGVFDITKSSDFATLLTSFRECGYSVSYRIFDSKYFGVPQRRRRVFVVGHLGNDWRPSTAVLFERDSMRRDFAPGKEKRKGTAGTTETSVRSYGINGTDLSQRPDKINIYENESVTITKGGTSPGHKSHVITKWPAQKSESKSSHVLVGNIDYEINGIQGDDITGPLLKGSPSGGGQPLPAVCYSNPFQVRRLTPLECGRLQGFPDGYGNIPGASDTALYAAFGNSMTVNVMKWIGERIDKVDKILKSLP